MAEDSDQSSNFSGKHFPKKKKKKSPSKKQRDAKRREAYLAKQSGQESNLPTVLPPGKDPTSSRRMATPGRKLKVGNEQESEPPNDSRVISAGSPIPQLDGGEAGSPILHLDSFGDGAETENTGNFTNISDSVDDSRNPLRWTDEDFRKFGEMLDRAWPKVESDKTKETADSNEANDHFEDAKHWAISQKKS